MRFDIFGMMFEASIANLMFVGVLAVINIITHLYAQKRSLGIKIEFMFSQCYFISGCLCVCAADFIGMFVTMELMMIFASAVIFCSDSTKLIAKRYLTLHFIAGTLILIGISYFIEVYSDSKMLHLTPLLGVSGTSYILGLCLLTGLVINAAVFPFAWWMPSYYSSTTNSSFMLLTSITTKVGIILIMKLLTLLQTLGILSCIYSIVYGARTNDLRKIFCYLSILQGGFLMMSIGTTDISLGSDLIFDSISAHISCMALLGLYLASIKDMYRITKISEFSLIVDNTTIVSILLLMLILAGFPISG